MSQGLVKTEMPAEKASAELHEIDVEAIDLFVRIIQFLGLPKSIGEIYGLIFMAHEPLSLDDVCGRLSMSKGSASQGLRHLRQLGAIKLSYVPGDRRDLYVIEASLKQTVAGFLKERLQPGVADLGDRVERLQSKVALLGNGKKKRYSEKIQRLQKWQQQAQDFLPAITRLLG